MLTVLEATRRPDFALHPFPRIGADALVWTQRVRGVSGVVVVDGARVDVFSTDMPRHPMFSYQLPREVVLWRVLL